MPSKTKSLQPTHEIPCPQEDRLRKMEDIMDCQKECLIRIEEKIKNDYTTINKIDEKLERLVEGNSTPGIPTRLSNLEQKHDTFENHTNRSSKLMWTLQLLIFAAVVTAFIAHIWPKT